MIPAKLRSAAYVAVAAKGLLTAVAPRLSARIDAKLWLPGYENTGDLEPSDWYVRSIRAAGVGMLAAGLTGFLLESRVGDEASTDIDGVDRIDSGAEGEGDAFESDGIDRIDTDADDADA